MSQSTNNRAVFVTGTSSGIGRATALHLDKLGYEVFATVRKTADAEQLKQDASPRLRTLLVDITNREQIDAAAAEVATILGPQRGLYALVNNAGIAEGGPLECMAMERLQHQFNVNVFGPAAVTQAFLPLVLREKGRVVNVVSAISDSVIPFLSAYSASKFALRAITMGYRRELWWWDVKVSMILPGLIDGPIWDQIPKTLATVEREDATGRYPELLNHLVKFALPAMKASSPPTIVGETIGKCLAARSPRAIYRCGPGSWTSQFGDWAPEWMINAYLARYVRRQRSAAAKATPTPAVMQKVTS